MPASSSDTKLGKYWSMLSPRQKRSLLDVIRLFVLPDEVDHQLQEGETEYGAGDFNFAKQILKQLSQQQKEALIVLVRSFGVEDTGQRISLAQYNKELDEAESEFEKGEVFTHEEVIAMTKKWIHGK
jgi:hypothetical protein